MAEHEHDSTDVTGNQEDTNQLLTLASQPDPATGSSSESQPASGTPAAVPNDTSVPAPGEGLRLVQPADSSTDQPTPPALPLLNPRVTPPAPADAGRPDSTVESLTYSGDELAVALGAGVASVDRWDQAGILPRAIRLGGRKVWLRETIAEWLRLGAPTRKEFEARQNARQGGKR